MKDFPKDFSEQSNRATEIVRDIIKKVLNREEPFTLTVRKTTNIRFAKDSSLVIVPPIEVSRREG